ncbi:MAG: damage-inducible protein DinB, partial [Deinococcota bacterium]|nr:damage-inducible protein DinB [Deinococcota bacterium]
GLADLYEPDADDFVAETDPARIREVMAQTHQTALEAADVAEGTGELPHSSVEASLIHMMVHDAHPRGQLLLALKTAGHALPDEDLMWGPWRGEGDRA